MHYLALISLFSVSLVAWNEVGHQVVAQIAWNQFSSNEQAKIKERMGDLMSLAPVPDQDRELSSTLAKWHYINYPWVFEPIATPIKLVPKEDNIVWALKEAKKVLKRSKDGKNTPFAQVFKANFVHLMGDIHQPLHCIARVTLENPKGDKGGNLFEIQTGKKKINLHRFWDIGLGLLESADVQALALQIEKELPKTKMKLDGDFETWAKESYALAKSDAYATAEGVLVSESYVKQGQKVVKERLALAGYRLAAQLRELFL